MMWLGVYQSDRCWELPDVFTPPSQSFTVPHSQIQIRPISHSATICTARTAMKAISPVQRPRLSDGCGTWTAVIPWPSRPCCRGSGFMISGIWLSVKRMVIGIVPQTLKATQKSVVNCARQLR